MAAGEVVARPNFSFGSARSAGTAALSDAVAAGLSWLLDHQNADGSWGDDNPLDRLISTNHACLAFQTAGFSPGTPALVRGLAYLRSDRVTHESKYWRIAPLAGVPEARDDVEASLRTLRHRFTGQASPSPDQIVPVFLINALRHLGRAEEARQYVGPVLDRFTADGAWAGRADSTSHALSALLGLHEELGTVLPDRYVRAGRDLIVRTAAEPASRRYAWCGRVTSTCYTVINVAESALWDDEELQRLSQGAAAWIRDQQDDDGSWPTEDPPYGGAADLTSRCYFTAVAVRGLVAFGVRSNPVVFAEIQERFSRRRPPDRPAVPGRERELRRSLRRWRWAAVVLAVAGLGGLALWQRARLAGVGGAVVAAVAVISGIVAVLDMAGYLGKGAAWSRRLRRRDRAGAEAEPVGRGSETPR